MLQLHDNPFSPFCRKVQVLLHESGQKDDVEILYAVGTALAPEKMPTAHNPLGKIPTLVRDDGHAIYDSRVICRYLDARGKSLILRGAGTGTHAEAVDLAADYARSFGGAPQALVGVAVSADSDDTETAIRAWISDMVIR